MNEHDMRLAAHVAVNMDNWRVGEGCPAWIESADRKCGSVPMRGYLCNRHHNIAVKRQTKLLDTIREENKERAECRARKLPEWKEALAEVSAEIERNDRPVVRDRAAFGGVANKSIEKKRKAGLSDAKVQHMAHLVAKHNLLTKLIGGENV